MNSLRLVLFDIDGTLLTATQVSKLALIDALAEVYGLRGPLPEYDFSGKTDPQIARDVMLLSGRPAAEVEAGLPRCMEVYCGILTGRLQASDVRAKPGVHALVAALHGDPRVRLALLTGNLEPCARAKLQPLDLNRYFPFGAYASDHADRYRLPAVAVTRARDVLGHEFAGKRIVIVGDSVHDVRCGQTLGVRAVAVATGPTAAATLRAEGPDALLDDFADTAAALQAILG
jgi:phosphoglycolate phosphatase-like HAD superfamily hydrolase